MFYYRAIGINKTKASFDGRMAVIYHQSFSLCLSSYSLAQHYLFPFHALKGRFILWLNRSHKYLKEIDSQWCIFAMKIYYYLCNKQWYTYVYHIRRSIHYTPMWNKKKNEKKAAINDSNIFISRQTWCYLMLCHNYKIKLIVGMRCF